jgi:hypothetical protein
MGIFVFFAARDNLGAKLVIRASTSWKRMRLSLGWGASAASHGINSSSNLTIWSMPSPVEAKHFSSNDGKVSACNHELNG